MSAGRPHVLTVGFHAGDAAAVDFDAHTVTAVMPAASAGRLPADVAARFARIATIDMPDSTDLEAYDHHSDTMRDRAIELAAEFGPPIAVLGLYEHTTLPAARLREHFELPGTGVRTAVLCRDKVRMKQALAGAGVRVPRYLAVGPQTPRDELERFTAGLPGRIVLKPRSQGASVGVSILDGAADVLAAADAGRIGAGYEIEEFVDGTIMHIDGVVRDGVVRWLCPSLYLQTCFNFQHGGEPLSSVTTDDPDLTARVAAFTGTVLRGIGLTDSVFHLEAFLTPGDELVFLEIGNRFGGAGIVAHQRDVHGVDLPVEAVLACLGLPSRVAAPSTPLDTAGVGASGWMYVPLGSRGARRVVEVVGADHLPGTVLRADVPAIGDVLGARPDVWPSSGRFLVAGESTAVVERDLTSIAAGYSVTTEAGE